MTLPEPEWIPTTSSGSPPTHSRFPIDVDAGSNPSDRAAIRPRMTSPRPASGGRPASSRAPSWTSQAAGVTPRKTTELPVFIPPAGSVRETGIAMWISGEIASTPPSRLRPSTLAARIPEVCMPTSLRSMLSTEPAAIRIVLRVLPLATIDVRIPVTNPAEARTSSTTSMLPPIDRPARPGLRARLRVA